MKGVAVFLVVLAVVSLAMTPGDAISCSDVQTSLSPCIDYVAGTSSEPSASCCSAVSYLAGSLSKEDREAACNCIKSAAANFNLGSAAANLPGKCGVTLGVDLSPDMDCSKF